MSDIDRRRYTLGREVLLAYDRDGKLGDHYHHESAVRELVEALRDARVDMLDLSGPMGDEIDDRSICVQKLNGLLAHYKDM